jgi:hypothetical protein
MSSFESDSPVDLIVDPVNGLMLLIGLQIRHYAFLSRAAGGAGSGEAAEVDALDKVDARRGRVRGRSGLHSELFEHPHPLQLGPSFRKLIYANAPKLSGNRA